MREDYQIKNLIKYSMLTMRAIRLIPICPNQKKSITLLDFNIFAVLGFVPTAHIPTCDIINLLLNIIKASPNKIASVLNINSPIIKPKEDFKFITFTEE